MSQQDDVAELEQQALFSISVRVRLGLQFQKILFKIMILKCTI